MINDYASVLKDRLHDVLDSIECAINDLKDCNTYALKHRIDTRVLHRVKTNIYGDEIKIIEAKLKDNIELLELIRNSLIGYGRKLC